MSKSKKLSKPKKKVPVLAKPIQHSHVAWHWDEVIQYIEKKYKISIHDYKGNKTDPDGDYRNFWHLVVDRYDFSNGSLVDMYFKDWGDDLLAEGKPWAKEICDLFVKEFGAEMTFYISW